MSENPYESPAASNFDSDVVAKDSTLPYRSSKLGAAMVGFAGGILIPIAFSCFGLYMRYSWMNDTTLPPRSAHYDPEFQTSWTGTICSGLLCGICGSVLALLIAIVVDSRAARSAKQLSLRSSLRSEGDAESFE